MNVSKDLNENVTNLKALLNSEDITFLDVNMARGKGCLIFVNDLVNKDSLGELILRPANQYQGEISEQSLFNLFLSPEKKKITDLNQLVSEVVSGSAILVIDTISTAISFGMRQFEKRAITEPPTSTVLKGPREGFVENCVINMSLIRKSIKTPNLCYEKLSVGKQSQTAVELVYLKNVANEQAVKGVRDKINKINVAE